MVIVNTSTNAFDLDPIEVDFCLTKRVYDFYFINPFDIKLFPSNEKKLGEANYMLNYFTL